MRLAVLAGVLAMTGSVFGKISGLIEGSSLTHWLLKLLCVVFMITSNTAGCSCFVKSLQNKSSSLPITLASAATNYFCSVFVGTLFFGESTTLTWWCGTSLVLFGLLLICNAENTNKDK